MPFEINPVVVGSGQPQPGLPAEPVNTTAFGPVPAPPSNPIPGTPPAFLQWKSAGELLGEADVLVVDFVHPLIATRGVGEHENVITVRRFTQSSNVALTGVGAVGSVGDVGTGCVSSSGPFLLRDDWTGAAQSAATYTHDTNTVGAPNWGVSGSVVTDGAGHLVLAPNTSMIMTLALAYPRQIGFTINALSDPGGTVSFGLQGLVDGSVLTDFVEAFLPALEIAPAITFDWALAMGKEIIIEYVSLGGSAGNINVYQCGTLIGTIGLLNQLQPMAFFTIGNRNFASGPTYLDYLWIK